MDPNRAFFAAVRAETEASSPPPVVEVPRSFRAAMLAGIVVACGLAGLDATARIADLERVGAVVPARSAGTILVPALILLAVLGGGRAAATSLLLAHETLSRMGQRSLAAYALGGAAAAGIVSMIFTIVGFGSPHGLAIDILGGAAGGFVYRVFAGTRPANDRT